MNAERRMLACALVLIGIALSTPTYAATITASSATLVAVQTALNSASTGDTVIIPAGSAIWSGTATDNGRALKIVGAGIGSTTITAVSGTDNWLFLISGGTRISSISFVNGLIINQFGQDWRIHHCSFDNGETFGMGVWIASQDPSAPQSRGLIDHCSFHNSRVVVDGTAWTLSEGNQQNVLWNRDVKFGGPDFVFIEDCNFSGDQMNDVVDSRAAGSYVFRYNTYTDTKPTHNGYMAEVHSIHSTSQRASRAWEIYNNTIISTSGMWAGIGYIRGGTGVCFNNTVIGTTQVGVVLNNMRDTEVVDAPFGICDGTSIIDQNTPGQQGWRARDQIGSGKDNVLWAVGNAYDQAFEPAYFWNNTPSTIDINFPSIPVAHIVEGRDYYNRGIARPGYTPYTYPHPLTMSAQAPQPPTGLRIRS